LHARQKRSGVFLTDGGGFKFLIEVKGSCLNTLRQHHITVKSRYRIWAHAVTTNWQLNDCVTTDNYYY